MTVRQVCMAYTGVNEVNCPVFTFNDPINQKACPLVWEHENMEMISHTSSSTR